MKNRFDRIERPFDVAPDPIVPTELGAVLGNKPCNVRENPSISAKVIRTLNPGMTVSICDTVYNFNTQKPDWYKIKFSDGGYGFVSSGHIEVV